MIELDGKLIKVLKAIRTKGGVRIVCATADALIRSNPSLLQHFSKMELPSSVYLQTRGFIHKVGNYWMPTSTSWTTFETLAIIIFYST